MPDHTAGNKRTAIMDAAFDSIIVPTSDSDDGRNEPAQPPPKRKHGPGKKNKEVVNDEVSQEPLSYMISIYTIAQMKKDPKKHGNSKNTVLCLEPEAIWDTFVAQLLVINLKDYVVTFSVP